MLNNIDATYQGIMSEIYNNINVKYRILIFIIDCVLVSKSGKKKRLYPGAYISGNKLLEIHCKVSNTNIVLNTLF